MRQLNGHDVFMALKVLQKIGVKDELVEFAVYLNDQTQKQTDKDKLQQQLGAKLIFGVLANCGAEEAEKAFFNFLAGPLESTPDALAAMDLMDLVEFVNEWLATVDKERWRAFFISLGGLTKKLP